jgi:glucose/arabinose dehydrogenase
LAITPLVYFEGQNGMLGVFLSPHYTKDHNVYLTYAEPGNDGGDLALARRSPFLPMEDTSSFQSVSINASPRPGPEPTRRQDPAAHSGRKTRSGQSEFWQEGRTDDSFNRPAERHRSRQGSASGEQLHVPRSQSDAAETWASGVRTPYGLAFSPTGELWEVEHGPRGGDELNLIEPGKNYGWPLVCYGKNYDGVPIPNPDTRPI